MLFDARERKIKKKWGPGEQSFFASLFSYLCCVSSLSFFSLENASFWQKKRGRVGEWEIFCTLAERSSLRSSAHLSSLRVRVHTVGPDLYTHKRASREVKEHVSSWGEQMCIVIIVFFCFLSTRALSGSTERSRFVPWCECASTRQKDEMSLLSKAQTVAILRRRRRRRRRKQKQRRKNKKRFRRARARSRVSLLLWSSSSPSLLQQHPGQKRRGGG